MNALAFVDRYKAIRQQYYTPRPEPVSRPKTIAVVPKKYVYSAPIGPDKPGWWDQIKKAAEEQAHLKTTKRLADQILREVCQKHNVTDTDLRSERRPKYLTDIRHELYYRLATETSWSYPRIGRYLGGRDHTTILHGRRKFESKLKAGEVTL